MRFLFYLLTAMLLGTGVEAAAPPIVPGPQRAFVHSGYLFHNKLGFDAELLWIETIAIGKDTAENTMTSGVGNRTPVRWHVTPDLVWTQNFFDFARDGLFNSVGVMDSKPHRLLFREDPDSPVKSDYMSSALTEFSRMFRGVLFDPELYHDMQALGKEGVRQFILTNCSGVVWTDRSNGTPQIKHQGRTPNRRTPHWSFQVYRGKGILDAKNHTWRLPEWDLEAEMPVVFKETFHAVVLKSDFYFVTKSGKIYLTKEPAKGGKRSLQLIHDEPTEPIEMIISDTDTGKHFAFCKAPDKKSKPSYFEIEEKFKKIAYDPKSVKQPIIEEPGRRLQLAARILVAAGKVNGKAVIPQKP